MKDKKEKWWKRLLQGLEQSPGYSLFLSVCWFIVLLVRLIEQDFALNVSHIPAGLGALIFLVLAIYIKVKYWKRNKDADKEHR